MSFTISLVSNRNKIIPENFTFKREDTTCWGKEINQLRYDSQIQIYPIKWLNYFEVFSNSSVKLQRLPWSHFPPHYPTEPLGSTVPYQHYTSTSHQPQDYEPEDRDFFLWTEIIYHSLSPFPKRLFLVSSIVIGVRNTERNPNCT